MGTSQQEELAVCSLAYCFLHNMADMDRAHIFEDLEPLVCTVPWCDNATQTYGTPEAWASHMIQHHRLLELWICIYCTTSFPLRNRIQTHLRHEHNIAPSALAVEASQCHKVVPDNDRQCDLCGKQEWNSPQQYLDHVRRHLEDIALTTVPNCAFDEDDEDAIDLAQPTSPEGVPESQAGPAFGSSLPLTAESLRASQTPSPQDLDFLRQNPQFRQLRQVVQQKPEMLEPILEQVGAGNPQLAQLIGRNSDAFLQLLYEVDSPDEPDANDTTQLDEDFIERLLRPARTTQQIGDDVVSKGAAKDMPDPKTLDKANTQSPGLKTPTSQEPIEALSPEILPRQDTYHFEDALQRLHQLPLAYFRNYVVSNVVLMLNEGRLLLFPTSELGARHFKRCWSI